MNLQVVDFLDLLDKNHLHSELPNKRADRNKRVFSSQAGFKP